MAQLPTANDPAVFAQHPKGLETLGLLKRHEGGMLFIPFTSIEMILRLVQAA